MKGTTLINRGSVSVVVVSLLLLLLLLTTTATATATATAAAEKPPVPVQQTQGSSSSLSSPKQKRTALVFGSSGVVGTAILRSIINNPFSFWDKVILVGRQFPQNVLDDLLLSSSSSSSPSSLLEVVKIQLSDLTDIDKNEEFIQEIMTNLNNDYGNDDNGNSDNGNSDNGNGNVDAVVDACFIGVGVGHPYNMTNLYEWHTIEVDMVASMARFCSSNHLFDVKTITVLSAIDAEQNNPKPYTFTEEEIDEIKIKNIETIIDENNNNNNNNGDTNNGDNNGLPPNQQSKIGWWKMLVNYSRMKGLEEMVVINESSNKIPYIRLFQPSSIITTENRYGWVDWIIFRIHYFFDPILPTQYHSVNAEILGMAMVNDAVRCILSSGSTSTTITITSTNDPNHDHDHIDSYEKGVTRLTYRDYLSITTTFKEDDTTTTTTTATIDTSAKNIERGLVDVVVEKDEVVEVKVGEAVTVNSKGAVDGSEQKKEHIILDSTTTEVVVDVDVDVKVDEAKTKTKTVIVSEEDDGADDDDGDVKVEVVVDEVIIVSKGPDGEQKKRIIDPNEL